MSASPASLVSPLHFPLLPPLRQNINPPLLPPQWEDDEDEDLYDDPYTLMNNEKLCVQLINLSVVYVHECLHGKI